MKGLQIVVVLLVLSISTLEALKCNSCAYENDVCTEEQEDCEDPTDVCGTVICSFPRYVKTKSCLTVAEVTLLSNTNHFNVTTCSTDLCN